MDNMDNMDNTIFDCSQKQLITLPPEIEKLPNLTKLWCSFNLITSLPPEIGKLTNLTALYCSYNNLTSLPPEIGKLTNLTELYCSGNLLTSLPPEIGALNRLQDFNYSDNPIEYIPPNVINMLNRMRNRSTNIYTDKQSVHNHSIQEGVKASINHILKHRPTIQDLSQSIIENSILTEDVKTLLFEYMSDDEIHSILNITFKELLTYVYSLIIRHKDANEIFKIMNAEMNDSACKCFTGRISRLTNCLNGFDDGVKITISDNEQIGNIIIAIREKLESGNTYSIERHKEIVRKELEERGYDKDLVDSWLEHIE